MQGLPIFMIRGSQNEEKIDIKKQIALKIMALFQTIQKIFRQHINGPLRWSGIPVRVY